MVDLRRAREEERRREEERKIQERDEARALAEQRKSLEKAMQVAASEQEAAIKRLEKERAQMQERLKDVDKVKYLQEQLIQALQWVQPLVRLVLTLWISVMLLMQKPKVLRRDFLFLLLLQYMQINLSSL